MMVTVVTQFLGEIRGAAANLLWREFLEDSCHTSEIVILMCGKEVNVYYFYLTCHI